MNIFNIMLSPDKGGLQQMSVIYALAMQKKGHNVTCVLRKDSPYINILKESGIPIYIYKSCTNYNLFRMFNLAVFMKKNKTDVVLCHGRRAISVVSNSIIRVIINPIYKLIGVMHSKECKLKNKCDKLIFLTKTQLQKQEADIQNKSYVLSNTILDMGDNLNRLHSPIVFGAMGRLHKIKGYDILIKALAILKMRKNQFKFILAGKGPEENKLLNQIKKLNLNDVVDYIGWVDDKINFFKQIDVFILSSRSDVMPLSILESFSYSKPVISTMCDGPKEIMLQEFSSMLVSVEDENALAIAMENIIKNKNKISALGRKAKKLFIEQYSFLTFSNKLNTILHEVVNVKY